MAISYSVEKHTLFNPGALIAQDYGEHMLSLNITENTDNGRIVKVGKMTSLDQWDIDTDDITTGFKAYIAMKGADGTYLVVIDEVPDDKTAVIYQQPIINEESPKALTSLYNFYNDPADGSTRAYVLHVNDRGWWSAEGFDGTPAVGAEISEVSGGKLKIS